MTITADAISPGFHPNIAPRDYYNIKLWSATSLKLAIESPMHARHMRDHGFPATAAMQLGTAVHTAMLEPTAAIKRFAVYEGERRGKAWKEFEAANIGKTIVTGKEFDKLTGMVEALRANEFVASMVDRSSVEMTAIFDYRVMRFRSRFDMLDGDDCICDIKTTKVVQPHAVASAAAKYGYHFQAAFYSLAAEVLTGRPHVFKFIWVQKSPPHQVWVQQLDAADMAMARAQVDKAIDVVAECEKTNNWPGYDHGGTLRLPEWVWGDGEEESDTMEELINAF